MAYTEKFRMQHDELVEKADLIEIELDKESFISDTSTMYSLVSNLLSKLKGHLALEDKSLYPQLKNCGNHEVAAIAMQYQADMGGIADFANNYSKKWSSAKSISTNSKLFIDETKQLISALKKRIQKENNYLYILADDCL